MTVAVRAVCAVWFERPAGPESGQAIVRIRGFGLRIPVPSSDARRRHTKVEVAAAAGGVAAAAARIAAAEGGVAPTACGVAGLDGPPDLDRLAGDAPGPSALVLRRRASFPRTQFGRPISRIRTIDVRNAGHALASDRRVA